MRELSFRCCKKKLSLALLILQVDIPPVLSAWCWRIATFRLQIMDMFCTEILCVADVPGQKVPSVSNGEMADHCLKKIKVSHC
ncbi:hypothetical protein OIU76_022514 [Salix suchowensis]|nr:hypothetical protein OIU76_022514 [Salix suchowensis]